MTAAIEARDIFRIHQTAEGDAAALQGLSLTVQDGETVTVLGPSGSGKSTFLRILAGLDRPSAGTVRVFGVELAKLPARDVARYRTRLVGYADQHYARALAPELTARELIGLELGLAGATAAERDRRADELLERVGLRDKRTARSSSSRTSRPASSMRRARSWSTRRSASSSAASAAPRSSSAMTPSRRRSPTA